MKLKMEKEVLEKVSETHEQVEEKKYYRILGITLWRIFAYFIIYSVIGFIVETLFGLIKYGMLESRQSFLYGPFCAIYGIGAIIMILSLQYFKKSYNTLFIGGCIVGSLTEYIVSWIGEVFLHLKWWDYSNMPFNLNGRICLLYSIFWGFLGLYLIISLNPRIDKLINLIKEKINKTTLKTFVTICIILMIIDCILTAFALFYFTVRTIHDKYVDVNKKDYIEEIYEGIYSNQYRVKIIDMFFNNEKMLKTFPRLTLKTRDGSVINVRDLYPDIKTYYYKLKISNNII